MAAGQSNERKAMPYALASDRKAHNARYGKLHYAKNRDAYIGRARVNSDKHREAVKVFIQESKNTPCKDCGKSYPSYVMHFDHLRDKEFHIGNAMSGSYSIRRLVAEMKKCEVVCANCHAIRTHERKRKT